MKINNIKAFEVLDSRGNPTVATKIETENNIEGFAISPSGASTGIHEAHELRDMNKNRYNGKGVLKAVNNINEKIKNEIIGKGFNTQREFDELLLRIDGTENKEKIGANAILSASIAFAKTFAKFNNTPLFKSFSDKQDYSLPRPMMNILNGGAHSGNNLDIQEFMIIPCLDNEFKEKVRICAEIYHKLGEIIKSKVLGTGVGDEGGYAPELNSEEEAIELIISAIESSGYSTNDIKIGLDVASSEWFKNGKYFKPKSKVEYTADELIDYYKKIVSEYPIISIEDPLAEDDFENFKIMQKELGDKIQIVGDDLFVTNMSRLKMGVDEKLANAILIKPNQIGTLTETFDVINYAKNNNIKTIISHRSGESEDTTISDIAVGLNVGQIKTGAPCRTDRVCKYNRLLIIENEFFS